MSDDSDPAQSYPDRNFASSIDNLQGQIQILRNYYELYPEHKAKIDKSIAEIEAAIKVLQELPPPPPTSKGGKRRSKRAHSKRRVHRKAHRKSHRRH
jgi:hypothetical protein